jgi:uncharacterized membrane protein YphA (DoxX/SURF4 family)
MWAMQLALAVTFVGAGGAKLIGLPMAVEMFRAAGLAQWLRYVTGVLEVTGAVLLLRPRLVGFGALLLMGVMVGAILTKLVFLREPPYAATALLIGLAIVAGARRQSTSQLLSSVRHWR